jgi:hypothetical protein
MNTESTTKGLRTALDNIPGFSGPSFLPISWRNQKPATFYFAFSEMSLMSCSFLSSSGM